MRWWDLAERWLREADGLAHGSVETALARFAVAHDRKPISVRKAAAAYRFIHTSPEFQRLDARMHLARLPLEAVETVQRLSRFKQIDLSSLIDKILEGALRGRDLEREEMRLRAEAQAISVDLQDTHVFRLGARPFRTYVQKRLATLFPSPSTCVSAHAIARNPLLACDSLVRGPAGYAGVKIIATRSGGNRTAWRREILHEGLAKSRVFQEFFYICQHHADAEVALQIFEDVTLCGVGLVRLCPDASFDVLRRPRRDAEPDLASRFANELKDAFTRSHGQS